MAHQHLIVLPDDSARPVIEAIEIAQRSLRIKMFVFSDPSLIEAVAAAQRRGVDVRVMLNPARRDGTSENDAAREALVAAGARVADSNPAYGITHEKSMVVDDAIAFIKSLNWETKNFTTTRDYAVRTTHPKELQEIMSGFDADWDRQSFDPGANAQMVWCPGNGRGRICQLIDDARHSLFVQNERYQDTVIIERLVRAAERGVRVHAMVRAPHTLKIEKMVEAVGGLRILADVGVKVHKLKHLKLHAKAFLADDALAMIGSINLAPGSLDDRRELAIESREPAVVERLREIAHHDWHHSQALDLSDEGLLKDIGERKDAVALLALETT